MSVIREFRSALEKALEPQAIEPKLWRAGHRASSHMLEIGTDTRVTVLYVKESNKARGFWGLTKSHLDSLNKAGVSWFAVLLHRSAERGYILSGQEVSRLVRDGTFELSDDGDYKVNEQSDLDAAQSFSGIPELVGRVL